MAKQDPSPEQNSTSSPPSPTASDGTNNATKGSASKDRQCPFCHQSFTSSSLGRHLDTFIRDRNPKAPDGIHKVVEIRAMRNSITRRHARAHSSAAHAGVKRPPTSPLPSQRQLPVKEPIVPDNVLPQPVQPRVAPPIELVTPQPQTFHPDPQQVIPKAHWTATGVINNLPPRTTSTPASRDLPFPRVDAQSAYKSPPFPHTAIEDSRHLHATELALKETVDAIVRAAGDLRSTPLFDFDIFALNFAALCLRLLSAPPTLFSSTPQAVPTSWPIDDIPSQTELANMRQALTKRISEYSRDIQQSFGADSTYVLGGVTYKEHHFFDHLNQAFTQWNQFSEPQQQHIWRLEILRAFTEEVESRKDAEHRLGKMELESAQLKAQLSSATSSAPPHISQQLIKRLLELDPTLADWDVDRLVAKWKSTLPSLPNRFEWPANSAQQLPPVYDRAVDGATATRHSRNSPLTNGNGTRRGDADVAMQDSVAANLSMLEAQANSSRVRASSGMPESAG